MRKLKLEVADLKVASFDVRVETEHGGTVIGALNETASGKPTCDHAMETCAQTCSQQTCFGTCIAVLCA